MSNDGREFVGFPEDLWKKVDETVGSVFAALAACRRALPVSEQLGAKTVLVRPMDRPKRTIDGVKTFASVASAPKSLIPLRLWTHLEVDAQDLDDAAVVLGPVEDAASRLAKAEDASLLLGTESKEHFSKWGAGFDGALPADCLISSDQFISPDQKTKKKTKKVTATPKQRPAQDVIIDTISELEGKGIVGRFAAIVSPKFMGNARTPGVPGGADSVPHILDMLHTDGADGFVSSSILSVVQVAGVVLRTQAKAFELIFTAKPRVVFGGRRDSTISLRVEESFVLACFDPEAVAPLVQATS